MGSVYWGLPGIMKLDPAGQELWHSGGVKAGGTPNPGLSEGGVRTEGWAVVTTTVSTTPPSTPSLGLSSSHAQLIMKVGEGLDSKGLTPRERIKIQEEFQVYF